jgi:hypothetical protein
MRIGTFPKLLASSWLLLACVSASFPSPASSCPLSTLRAQPRCAELPCSSTVAVGGLTWDISVDAAEGGTRRNPVAPVSLHRLSLALAGAPLSPFTLLYRRTCRPDAECSLRNAGDLHVRPRSALPDPGDSVTTVWTALPVELQRGGDSQVSVVLEAPLLLVAGEIVSFRAKFADGKPLLGETLEPSADTGTAADGVLRVSAAVQAANEASPVGVIGSFFYSSDCPGPLKVGAAPPPSGQLLPPLPRLPGPPAPSPPFYEGEGTATDDEGTVAAEVLLPLAGIGAAAGACYYRRRRVATESDESVPMESDAESGVDLIARGRS